jgi:hypothetical protein
MLLSVCRVRICRKAIRLFVATGVMVCAATMVGCYRRAKYPISAMSFPPSPSVLRLGESPERALQLYQERAQRQLSDLGGYSDETTIKAEVPASSKTGEVSLKETFSAPRTLFYIDVHFVGNGFIKNDVIMRLLTSQVDHVQRGMQSRTAVLESNYKFSYRGTEQLNGRPVFDFMVTPRRNTPGLFKGKIFLDSRTGHIRRATGRLSRSPSWWIKRVDFTQDYADFGDFTLPVYISSVTQARIIGRVLVTIQHSAYEARVCPSLQCSSSATLLALR